MSDVSTMTTEYVPRELFDIHLQSIKESAASNEKLNDTRITALEKIMDKRFDSFQAVMEKNLAEYKAEAAKTNGDIKTLNEKLEHVIDTLTLAINNSDKRLDDFKDENSRSITKWSIGVALFVGAVQVIVAFILYFLK